MRELIERYVRELVKIPSTSNTETEKSCADYIAEELAKQPYFKEYPEQTGKYLLPEDSFGRSVPWGLVKEGTDPVRPLSLQAIMTWWTQKSMEMSVLLLMMWKMGRSGKIWKCSAWYARGSEKRFPFW